MEMINLGIVSMILLSLALLLAVMFLSKRIFSLSSQLQISQGDFERKSSKEIQENFFRFQSVVLGQLDTTSQYNKFVFEELDKSADQLSALVDTKLSEIKWIVDEKLQQTLESRLSHSFKQVSDSLAQVQKGLGEMQTLASGVGDLKKVLSNVKSRGVLGEIQLGSLLDQLLSQEQFGINVSTIPNSRNHVEFAIKFPGASESMPYIWLPIDSKFPMECYEELLEAYESNDKVAIEKSRKYLAQSLQKMAMDINNKYVYPPYTTDFSIMFLPTESLYAEVLRLPGLIMAVQQKHKVMVVGPHNLAAFLTSLRQGFKSLAIEKRTDEVWKLLNIVKMEFLKFGEILDKTQSKILEANKIIETAGAKSRNISRKLGKLEQIDYQQPKIDV